MSGLAGLRERGDGGGIARNQNFDGEKWGRREGRRGGERKEKELFWLL